jgi:hypothetical protein
MRAVQSAPGRSEVSDGKVCATGFYFGVWLVTLVASLCAWIALNQPITLWQRHYWQGIVWWLVLWAVGCAVVRLCRLYPKTAGAIALGIVSFIVVGGVLALFFGPNALWFALLCLLFDWDRDKESRKFVYKPRRIVSAIALVQEQKRILRVFTAIGVVVTLSAVGWNYYKVATDNRSATSA